MNNINNLVLSGIIIITALIWFAGIYIRSRFSLHMIQLEGYKNKEYLNWIKEFNYRIFTKKLKSISAIIGIGFLVSVIIGGDFSWMIFSVMWVILMSLTIEFKREKAKKDLVYTQRAKRLFASVLTVNSLMMLIILVLYIISVDNFRLYYPLLLFFATAIYISIPYNMYIANLLVAPIEKSITKHYFDLAYNKIRTFEKLKVVGITGSFGKTSTKFVTASILGEKFNVLKTPDSYNTPMGISKVINYTLSDEYEVFVAEMGARNIGDIKELAVLSNPQIGILTSIGPTHLDTFVNIENIMKTKYELIEQLPADGIAIFNYDNTYVKRLADKTFKEKILYGMDNIEELDLYATDIEVTEFGSTFILKDKEGNSVNCKSQLLGKHNISNLLAGAAAGKVLGLSFDEIARGIAKVEPVPHRLQLLNPGTGVIVIDDGFNSNPIGSKAALDVISQFKEGKKIIVTPGMIELGENEEEENKEFGRNIGKVCDYVILIGKNRTKPIYDGLLEVGYNKENIFVANSLDDATKQIQIVVKPKDVILFENDLPDTYNE